MLLVLSLVVVGAALALALAMKLNGRAELALAASIIATGIIATAVHVLGWTGYLAEVPLAVLTTALASAALGLAGVHLGARTLRLQLTGALLGLLRMPLDALREVWEARSFLFVGVAGAGGLIVYTLWLSYLSPSGAWDGIWYHETIVGFAIQNRGFAIEPLPLSLQYVNGFPRVCESLNLWLVIFTDKRLIESANSLMAVPLMLSVYVLAQRAGATRVLAMGWASALLWMPGAVLQLRSTYIDVHVAALVLAAAHFSTRPLLRLRDSWLVILCLSLVMGAKGMGLAWVPLLALPFVVRLVYLHARKRPLVVLLILLSAVVLVPAFAGPFYVRNWLVFGNPIWPVRMESFDWPGWVSVSDLNKPLDAFLRDIYSTPVPGKDYHDTRVWGYGLGVPWLVLPAAVFSLPAAFFALVVRRGEEVGRRALSTLLASAPLLLMLVVSPKIQNARYNIHVVGALMLVVIWATARPRLERLSESLASVTVATSIMLLVWAKPGWSVTFGQALDLARRTAEERTTFRDAGFASTPKYRQARLREIGPRSKVYFTEDYAFPAEYWNERFTNEVKFVRARKRDSSVVLRELEALGATWVIVGEKGPLKRALDAAPEWSLVAPASVNHVTLAYRRASRTTARWSDSPARP